MIYIVVQVASRAMKSATVVLEPSWL